MATNQRHYLCKMLSGPHLGAEVRLAAGSYRVGRDDAADIVLEDQTLAAEHALLVIEPEGVRVEPLLGEVLIDHVSHKDAAARLPFFTVLGLGTTHLAVGPADAAWPALTTPVMPPAGAPGAAPPGAALVPAERGTPPVPAPPPAARSRRWGSWAPVLGAALLGAVLLARAFGGVEAPPPELPPPAAEPAGPADALAAAEPAVRAALEGIEVTGLKVAPDQRRGRVLVEGWVATEAERKALAERLGMVPAPLTQRVWSGEQVMEGVGTTLQALGRPLETSWVGAGEVMLRGYIPAASDLQRVVDLLQRDVTGLRAVRNEVMTDEGIEAWLVRRLADAGLAEAMRVRRGERGLQVRGVLDAAQRRAFEGVAVAYSEGPGRHLTLEAQIGEATGPVPVAAAAAPLLEPARFSVRAASPGPPPFVVLEDGQKYLEGGRLPGGWTLVRIGESAMLVSRDGRREQVAF